MGPPSECKLRTQEVPDNLGRTGCSILLLGTPNGLNVGIDYCMWKTGPRFKGITLMPPGPHFLYWSLDCEWRRETAEGENCEPKNGLGGWEEFRTGLFIYGEPGAVSDTNCPDYS